ncbi:unnamed protein product, partial [marine sediment metagenome]
KKAITELNIDDDLNKYYKLRQQITPINGKVNISLKERDKKIEKELKRTYKIDINFGTPQTYYKDDELDNRTAFGNVLKNFAELNCKKSLIYEESSNFNKSPISPIAVLIVTLQLQLKLINLHQYAQITFSREVSRNITLLLLQVHYQHRMFLHSLQILEFLE